MPVHCATPEPHAEAHTVAKRPGVSSVPTRGLPVSTLRARYLSDLDQVSEELLAQLEGDPRQGVKALARTLRERLGKRQREDERLGRLLRFETELRAQGYSRIAGVDEAGMAPLAGPVVAASVILPADYRLPGIDDSKKIANEKRREELALQIKADAIAWAVGRAEVEEIDRLNIFHAGLLAMRRAALGLPSQPDFFLVDARTIPDLPVPQRGVVHGDALSASIAAASIIAKTTRDRLMAEFDRSYPGYGLAAHKGYPTPEHFQRLRSLGASPIHRRSFAPVREVLRPGNQAPARKG